MNITIWIDADSCPKLVREFVLKYAENKNLSVIFTPEIWYWDSDLDLDVNPKSSPTDMGKEKFEEIIEEQLVRIY